MGTVFHGLSGCTSDGSLSTHAAPHFCLLVCKSLTSPRRTVTESLPASLANYWGVVAAGVEMLKAVLL